MKNNITNLGELDVIYKYKSSLNNRPVIKNSDDALKVLSTLFHKDKIGLQEQFVVIYLNRGNKVIGSSNLFTGGVSATVVDMKIILSLGLKLMASSILIAHNHPSGNIKPSEEDKRITSKICEASKLLEIQLLDHLIIAPDLKFFSFANEGLMKKY